MLHAPPFGSWSKPVLEIVDLMPLLHTLRGIPSWVHRVRLGGKYARKMKTAGIVLEISSHSVLAHGSWCATVLIEAGSAFFVSAWRIS